MQEVYYDMLKLNTYTMNSAYKLRRFLSTTLFGASELFFQFIKDLRTHIPVYFHAPTAQNKIQFLRSKEYRSFFLGLIIFVIFETKAFASLKDPLIKEQNNNIISNIIRYPNTSAIETRAKQVIIMDFLSGKILLEKNAYERMIPSSMTKIMTSYLIEDKIQKGEVTFDSQFVVSEKAWRMGGSKSFMPLGELVNLKDILYGIIIQSGNDACVVAAEGLAGSEENFVDSMNKKASEVGMNSTHFMNASGWPEENHYSTVYDIAVLGRLLIQNHSEFYPIYSEKYFTFGKDQKGRAITQGNRNPLLYKDLGCDGIKTGHTDQGGFGMVASFVDNARRYIMVINGLSSMQKRAEESLALLHWVKQNFTTKKIYNKGDEIGEAEVWLGVSEKVKIIVAEDVSALVTRLGAHKIESTTNFTSPIPAPIKAGEVIGKLKVVTNEDIQEIDLLAKDPVEKVGFLKQIWCYFNAATHKILNKIKSIIY
ncbi:D-alanyl-D-alanine carboxypeptidase family protein [Candidatus Tisiphia endosymbiont of Beris chalybata]|uniref:D-alanyl-D-alanine carboxypeptidase family protein n=1 Tax=Candidatus Tisiphia endosymbiont of Beris chalybata TaxID=3066262 RepID=UPI00312CB177